MLKELESAWVWMVSSMTQEGLFRSKNKLFTWKNHLEFRRSSIYSGGENSTGLHSLGFWCHRYENKAGFQHRGGPYDPGHLSNYAPTEKARIIQADSDSGYKSCSMEGTVLLSSREGWVKVNGSRRNQKSIPFFPPHSWLWGGITRSWASWGKRETILQLKGHCVLHTRLLS